MAEFTEMMHSLKPGERKVNRMPTGIESVRLDRVGGGIGISFDTGVSSSMDVLSPGDPILGGNPLTEPVITVSFFTPASERHRKETGRFTEDRGRLTLRGLGELQTQPGVPEGIQRDTVGFVSRLAEQLEGIDPGRVGVDANWGWDGDTRNGQIRDYLKLYTTPLRAWLAAYQALPSAQPAES